MQLQSLTGGIMSKVFFTDFRTHSKISLLKKFENLITEAGIDKIDFKGKFVAIKIHFGEAGNLAFIRHNYANTLAQYIRSKGGKVFFTDCNTLYTGSRTNAIDHMDTAAANGFNLIGCPGTHVIIADGLKGTDEVDVPVKGAQYCPTAKIGRAVVDADIIISLSHFKGHESACFGGAMKNLGMGCGSRAGKKDMHSSMRPLYTEDKCIGCKKCATVCAHDVQKYENGKLVFDADKCAGCGRCIEVCPTHALTVHTDEDVIVLNRKIAEYTKAVIDGKPNFHITLVMDISPFCDCYASNDAPIVPDVGMFASFDPVSLDKACIDAVNAQKACHNSRLEETGHCDCHLDNLTNNHPTTNWKDAIEYAQKLGLGTADYELVNIDK